MLVNAILPVTNFKGQEITARHINALKGPFNDGSYIKELDSLGFINRDMLKKVQAAAEAERERSVATSMEIVMDVLKNPRYAIEKGDNGYFTTVESPYNYRDTLECAVHGKEKFYAPVFVNEDEYRCALENIRQNGVAKDARKLNSVIDKGLIGKYIKLHDKAVDVLETLSGRTLSVCLPQDNTFGIIKPMTPLDKRKFLSEKVFLPFYRTCRVLTERIRSNIRSLRP